MRDGDEDRGEAAQDPTSTSDSRDDYPAFKQGFEAPGRSLYGTNSPWHYCTGHLTEVGAACNLHPVYEGTVKTQGDDPMPTVAEVPQRPSPSSNRHRPVDIRYRGSVPIFAQWEAIHVFHDQGGGPSLLVQINFIWAAPGQWGRLPESLSSLWSTWRLGPFVLGWTVDCSRSVDA